MDIPKMFEEAKNNTQVKILSGEDLMSEECDICKKERSTRAVVAMRDNDVRFNEEPFSTAPYIHQHNEPKHAANLERAVNWAGKSETSVNILAGKYIIF